MVSRAVRPPPLLMILDSPISIEQVRVFRKTVDIYYANGIPIAREWPRKPKQPNSEAQLAAREAMRKSSEFERLTPSANMARYRSVKTPPTASYRDLLHKSMMRIAMSHSLPLPPLVTSYTVYYVPAHNRTEVLVYYDDYPGFDDTTFPWSYQDAGPTLPRAFRTSALPSPCVRGASIRTRYKWTLSGWTPAYHQVHHAANNWYRLFILGYHVPLSLTVRHPSLEYEDLPYGPPYEQ